MHFWTSKKRKYVQHFSDLLITEEEGRHETTRGPDEQENFLQLMCIYEQNGTQSFYSVELN